MPQIASARRRGSFKQNPIRVEHDAALAMRRVAHATQTLWRLPAESRPPAQSRQPNPDPRKPGHQHGPAGFGYPPVTTRGGRDPLISDTQRKTRAGARANGRDGPFIGRRSAPAAPGAAPGATRPPGKDRCE